MLTLKKFLAFVGLIAVLGYYVYLIHKNTDYLLITISVIFGLGLCAFYVNKVLGSKYEKVTNAFTTLIFLAALAFITLFLLNNIISFGFLVNTIIKGLVVIVLVVVGVEVSGTIWSIRK